MDLKSEHKVTVSPTLTFSFETALADVTRALSSMSAPSTPSTDTMDMVGALDYKMEYDTLAEQIQRQTNLLEMSLSMVEMQLQTDVMMKLLSNTPADPHKVFTPEYMSAMRAHVRRLRELAHAPTEEQDRTQKQQTKVELIKTLFPPSEETHAIRNIELRSPSSKPIEMDLLPARNLVLAYYNVLRSFVIDSSVTLSFMPSERVQYMLDAYKRATQDDANRMFIDNDTAMILTEIPETSHSAACTKHLLRLIGRFCASVECIVDATFPNKTFESAGSSTSSDRFTYWTPWDILPPPAFPYLSDQIRVWPWRQLRELQIPGPLDGDLLEMMTRASVPLECLVVFDNGEPSLNDRLLKPTWNADQMERFLKKSAQRLQHLSLTMWTDRDDSMLARVLRVARALRGMRALKRLEFVVMAMQDPLVSETTQAWDYAGRGAADESVSVYTLFENDDLGQEMTTLSTLESVNATLSYVHIAWPADEIKRKAWVRNFHDSSKGRLKEFGIDESKAFSVEDMREDLNQVAEGFDRPRLKTVQVTSYLPGERLNRWSEWSVAPWTASSGTQAADKKMEPKLEPDMEPIQTFKEQKTSFVDAVKKMTSKPLPDAIFERQVLQLQEQLQKQAAQTLSDAERESTERLQVLQREQDREHQLVHSIHERDAEDTDNESNGDSHDDNGSNSNSDDETVQEETKTQESAAADSTGQIEPKEASAGARKGGGGGGGGGGGRRRSGSRGRRAPAPASRGRRGRRSGGARTTHEPKIKGRHSASAHHTVLAQAFHELKNEDKPRAQKIAIALSKARRAGERV